MKNIFLITIAFILLTSCSNDSQDMSRPQDSGGVGKGGSYARFTISMNHLYALHNNALMVYSLATPDSPSFVRSVPINQIWGATVETLFPYKNTLLFGTTNGMIIYSLASPSNPTFAGSFSHATACDPVVAENDTAYVTLRGGTACRGTINQLDILSITNLSNPRLIRSVTMKNPKGLGIDNNTLFVCDEDELVVFDVTNKANPIVRTKFSAKNAYDVIPYQNNLILSASDGIYQFNYSNLDSIRQTSKISVQP
jgi:hypothetical protein